jgi:hypothetical protein
MAIDKDWEEAVRLARLASNKDPRERFSGPIKGAFLKDVVARYKKILAIKAVVRRRN